MLRVIILFLIIPFICYSSIEIGFIGDSITSIHCAVKEEESYPHLIGQELTQEGYDIDIKNFSVSGSPTAGGLDIIDYLYQYCSPKIIVISLGMNDFLAYYPLCAMKNNLKSLIKKCLDNGSIPVLGRINLDCWVLHRGKDFTNEFNKLYLELPSLYHIPSFNFIDKEILTNSVYNIGDKIHPNAEGQRKICQELKSVLIPLLKEIK